MMQEIICKNCGGNEFTEDGKYRICQFCDTRYRITGEKNSVGESVIALNEDVSRLLHRWRENPGDADRYAKLILQIDPNNSQAKKQLSSDKTAKSGGCYVATAVYGSYDCPQVWTLRRYRDDMLVRTWYGRAFIRLYYTISPLLVKAFGQTAWFKKLWRGKLDRMVGKLNQKGVSDQPYRDRKW